MIADRIARYTCAGYSTVLISEFKRYDYPGDYYYGLSGQGVDCMCGPKEIITTRAVHSGSYFVQTSTTCHELLGLLNFVLDDCMILHYAAMVINTYAPYPDLRPIWPYREPHE